MFEMLPEDKRNFSRICGVPYTALPIATVSTEILFPESDTKAIVMTLVIDMLAKKLVFLGLGGIKRV